MVELIEGLGPGTVGLKISGTVTADEYRDVVTPAIERAFGEAEKVRALIVLEQGFQYESGAVWEDLKVGARHPIHWERIALVGDQRWGHAAMPVVSVLLPGKGRAFAHDELDAAREWVLADD